MREYFKSDEKWRLFRILAEFTEGINGSLELGFGTLDEFFEALTLVQTKKVYPMPIVLFGVKYWEGLLEWIEAQPLNEKLISPEDMDLLHLTDDVDEVVDIMVKHRKYKKEKIILAKKVN